jgi:hypothetical protein
METKFEVAPLVLEVSSVVRREILALAEMLNSNALMQLRPLVVAESDNYPSPLRNHIELLVAAANGDVRVEENHGEVEYALQHLLEVLFSRPYTTIYDVPEAFWQHEGLGTLCAAVRNKLTQTNAA